MCAAVEHFTIAEVREQLQEMAKNKAAGDSGLVIEMLQEASDYLLRLGIEILNDIIQPESQAPDA